MTLPPSHPFLLNPKQIPKEVADIFNAPSDDEEFVGFQDDAPMENLSEGCGSLDSMELEKQVRVFLFKTGVAFWKAVAGAFSSQCSPEFVMW